MRFSSSKFLHATSLTASILIAQSSAQQQPDAATIERDVLEVYNRYRAEYGNVEPLKWSTELVSTAKIVAADCGMAHSPPHVRHGAGENLAWGMDPRISSEAWGGEFKDYKQGDGFSNKTGHFTQMVWKSTKEVGCAYQGGCNNGYGNKFACHYKPTGNYEGQYAENVLPKGSGGGAQQKPPEKKQPEQKQPEQKQQEQKQPDKPSVPPSKPNDKNGQQPKPPFKDLDPKIIEKEILEVHNKYRAKYGNVEPLKWSAALVESANKWVSGCPRGHSGTANVSENIAWGTGGHPGDLAQSWADEEKNLRFDSPETGATGHITAMLWKGSKEIGCAMKECPTFDGKMRWNTMVCHYKPFGNVVGAYKENVLPPVSGSSPQKPPEQKPPKQNSPAPSPLPLLESKPASDGKTPCPLSAAKKDPKADLAPAPSSEKHIHRRSPPNETPLPQPYMDLEKIMLDEHNKLRVEYGATPVTWSKTLVESSLDWAKTCPQGGSPHSDPKNRPNAGENIGKGYLKPQDCTKAWGEDEAKWYNFGCPIGGPKPGAPPGSMVGHFSQMVWKGSKELGCAAWVCPGVINKEIGPEWNVHLVCQYSPAGNMAGKYAENVGMKGSKRVRRWARMRRWVGGGSSARFGDGGNDLEGKVE